MTSDKRSVMGDVLSIYIPSFFLHIGMSIVSPVLPIYARSFGVSYTVASLVISIYAFGRLITDLPAGLLADRLGRRPVLLSGTVFIILGSLLSALAQGFWELILYRLIQGVGSSMWMTSRAILIADVVRPEERGRVLSYFQAFMLLGSSAGPTMGGFLAAAWGLRAPFYAYAFAGFLCLLLSLALIHEPRRPSSGLMSRFPGGFEVSINEARQILSNKTFLVSCLTTFTVFFMQTSVRSTMIPLYVDGVLGLGEAEIGLALSFSTMTNLLTTIPMGHLMDKYGRKIAITWNLAMTGVSSLCIPFSYDPTTLFLSCVLLGMGMGGAGQAPMALATDVTMSSPRGLALGLYRFFGDIGFIVGPMFVGVLSDALGLRVPFFTVAFLVFFMAFLVQLFAVETVKRGGEA